MTRRAKGTGSITQSRGRWRWKYKSDSGYCDSRREAEIEIKWLREQEAAKGPETVLDYLQGWLDRREQTGRVKYVPKERGKIDAYVEPCDAFALIPLRRLARRDCVQWIRWLEQQPGRKGGLAKRTIQGVRGIVHRALEDALDDGVLQMNPLTGVRVVGGKRPREHDWLRPEEIDAILALDLNAKRRAIITTAVFTGLSPLELWSLRWSDVDFKTRTLHVRGDVKRVSRVRDVPLIKGTAEALKAWRRAQRKAREKRGEPTPINSLIWPNASGGRQKPGDDPARWRAQSYRRKKSNGRRAALKTSPSVPEQAGVDRHIVFRDLRHTFASCLVSGAWGPAIDLYRLAYLMGHKDVAATQIYAHLHPEGPIAAMRKLDGGGEG